MYNKIYKLIIFISIFFTVFSNLYAASTASSESITKVCTRDSCISKFNQLSYNTTIVMNFIKNKKLDAEYKDALVGYKNFIRSVLYPIVYDKQYYNIWNI